MAPTGDLVQDLITLGRKFLGKPYRYRGSLPWAMDCSGYVRYLFSCFGINLSGSSADLAKVTRTVQNPRPGDLLFFKGRNRRSDRIGHVALVVKVQGSRITMMHSTNSRGIVQEELQSSAYFSSRYIRAGRVPYLERTYSAAYREEDEKAQEKLLPIPAQALAWQAPNLFSPSFFGCVEDYSPPPSGEGFLTKGNPPMLRWLVVKMVNTRSGINRYGIANLGVHGRS